MDLQPIMLSSRPRLACLVFRLGNIQHKQGVTSLSSKDITPCMAISLSMGSCLLSQPQATEGAEAWRPLPA